MRVLCALYPDFDTLDVTLFCSVLDLAGQRWNHRAFELRLVSRVSGPLPGRPCTLSAEALSEFESADVLFVPGGRGASKASEDHEFVAELQRLGDGASARAAIGRGQLVLAAAGLLDGAACCDVETGADLQRRHPELALAVDHERDFQSDGTSYLGRKSLSALPLALQLVLDVLGSGEADYVAQCLGQRRRAPRVAVRG